MIGFALVMNLICSAVLLSVPSNPGTPASQAVATNAVIGAFTVMNFLALLNWLTSL